MFRSRLTGVALVSLAFLPGCGLFFGDRPRDGLCSRCKNRGQVVAAPMAYPMPDMGGCGGAVIPPHGMPPGGPTIIGQPYPGPGPGPMPIGPYGDLPTPRIPKAGIDEGKGKQFELEGASRSGPALSIPASGVK